MHFDVLPKATMRKGKYAADGLFFLSVRRLQNAGACYGAALSVISALTGVPGFKVGLDTEAVLDFANVERFCKAAWAWRVYWVAHKLMGQGLLPYNQYRLIESATDDGKFKGKKVDRDKVEVIFAMLEVVARKRGLLA